jgi:hypothetical protein
MNIPALLTIARKSFGFAIVLALSSAPAMSQSYSTGQPPSSAASPAKAATSASLGDLQAQIGELRSMISDMHDEVVRARADAAALRRELEETRTQFSLARASTAQGQSAEAIAAADAHATSTAQGDAASPESQSTEQRLTKLEDDQQVLSDKVDDQYQTKVESASKYHVRFSGIVLSNVFANRGSVENQDLPTWAVNAGPGTSSGNVGATLRQSQLGFEIFGPELYGAKTRADLQMDFAGGFSTSVNGENAGIVRLRTATFRMDWESTSLIAGQDVLFFSPLAPTSIATLALPALSYAGNLWTWTPQIRVEHRIRLADRSLITLQGGLLDPLTGDIPNNTFFRSPTAGEASRQPAYATRVSWSHPLGAQTFTIGAGVYYSRQNWGFHRTVDSWAATSDVLLPLGSRFEFSGEFYRGRAVGGLAGGIGQSVVFSSNPQSPASTVLGVHSTGGWAQLKYRATTKLEFNGAFGEDSPQASDLSAFPGALLYNGGALLRNQVSLGNFIYRPRSNLLFSLEYRHLRTYAFPTDRETANHINLSLGVLF